ncbi:unknown [Acetobacter sp. CAG:977]|nr:unknown [Acetobacter sp. CAG:977]
MRKMIIIMTSAIMLPISSFAIEQVPPPPYF